MIAALLAVKAVFAAIMAVWIGLVIGAVGGLIGAAGRGLWGLSGAALAGAAAVALVLFGGFVTDDSAQIARLKAENRALTLKAEELRVTGRVLRNTLSELSEQNENNEEVMGRLRAKLAKVPDRPDCVIDEEIVDELRKIQ